MSWFSKRKDGVMIPPVESDNPSAKSASNSTSPRPSYRKPNASTFVASRDDPYAVPASRAPLYPRRERDDTPHGDYDGGDSGMNSYADKYSRNKGVGDVYSRGGAELEKDRNELFAGYNPAKSGSGRFFDGPPLDREPAPGEENEDDIEGIKKQTRFVKQESANSTRNALRLAREAEETARNTLGRLGDQSEKLANTERHLDVSKGYSQRADDKTDELKQLNRSIFRPVIVFNKDAKRAAQEAKVQARYEEEREEREKAMMDVRETQNRLGRAQTYGREGDDQEAIGGGPGRRFRTAEQQAQRKVQRKRFQFEATASDDELEDEIDDNLDEISEVTTKLKALGTAMGQELDSQIGRIDRIEQKTVGLDNRIFRNTERLKRIK